MRVLRSGVPVVAGLLLSGLAHASDPPCGVAGDSQACMGQALGEAKAVLARYLAAAQERVDRDFDGKPDLEAAQAAWTHYRNLECGDVASLWEGGTYGAIAGSGCMLRLTRQRTHEIWQVYLTYEDSTPPLLPEPDRGSDP